MTNEEAIQELKTLEYYGRPFDNSETENKKGEALNLAIKALEQTRWIPINEKLPEEYKRIIVSDVFGVYIGQFVDAEENWGGKHFINEGGMHSKSVTAWMPLPQPYKEKSEVQDENSN